jgi:hypothetical protein
VVSTSPKSIEGKESVSWACAKTAHRTKTLKRLYLRMTAKVIRNGYE